MAPSGQASVRARNLRETPKKNENKPPSRARHRTMVGDDGAMVEAKRQRTENGVMIASGGASGGGALVTAGPQRTSELLAPIMLLSGHGAAVHTAKFSPDGRHLLSGSHDKTLLLWEVFGECRNVLTLKGHANAVLEAHWLGTELAVSASADKTCALWDVKTGGRVRLFKGHSSYVNSCCPSAGAPLLVSGGDDSSARVWDTRSRTRPLLLRHPLPVTAVAASASGNDVYTGCVDGAVRVFDLRQAQKEALHTLVGATADHPSNRACIHALRPPRPASNPAQPGPSPSGHEDIISSIALSPNGHSLLSNGMDNTLRCWDIRPFAPSEDRCQKTFLGAQHNYEKNLIKCNW